MPPQDGGLGIAAEPTYERDVAIGQLRLDCGAVLEDVVQRVSVYGEPRSDGSNVVLIAHALTGSSRVAEWWPALVGPGRLFDPAVDAVVGINALGGCYGSTGPASHGRGGKPYGGAFPVVTVRDIVRAQALALERIGVRRLRVVIGGSLGGMQALEWACTFPRAVALAVVVGAYDHFSAMGIAFNAVAREAIRSDPHFAGGDYYDADVRPVRGMELARKVAMLTYKSEELFARRFGRRPDRAGGDPYNSATDRFDVEGYLDHQGALFSPRMDPNTYLVLTRAMDLFDVGERLPERDAVKVVFVGISGDRLFPATLVGGAAERLRDAGIDSTYLLLDSDHGHDAFLAEGERLAALLAERLRP